VRVPQGAGRASRTRARTVRARLTAAAPGRSVSEEERYIALKRQLPRLATRTQTSSPRFDATRAQDRAGDDLRLAAIRHETELERYDRNLDELLGELRVALPGVQVLFAFLLVAPFNQRFGTVSSFERALYLCALLLTLLASILLIAPTMIHRLHFQLGAKAYIVHTANRLTIAGLAVLAAAMTAAVLLVTHYLFGPTLAIITSLFVVAGFALTWLVLPMRNRRAWLVNERRRERPHPGGGDERGHP